MKGTQKATHPKKRINWIVVKKQLDAGVDMATIAASQHVSEGTLRRRMREKGYNFHNDIVPSQPKTSSSG